MLNVLFCKKLFCFSAFSSCHETPRKSQWQSGEITKKVFFDTDHCTKAFQLRNTMTNQSTKRRNSYPKGRVSGSCPKVIKRESIVAYLRNLPLTWQLGHVRTQLMNFLIWTKTKMGLYLGLVSQDYFTVIARAQKGTKTFKNHGVAVLQRYCHH